MRVAIAQQASRSQSAMEYLMTYGWAILIIAVVLGSLYSLGVFNTANLQPKVPGGGCHVYRPNGPGTSWNVNLVGSCNNALPQYVAQFNGEQEFSGGSEITLASVGALQGNSQFTISLWFDMRSISPSGDEIIMLNNADDSASPSGFRFGYDRWWGADGSFAFWTSEEGGTISAYTGFPPTTDAWHQAVATYDGTTLDVYMDGSLVEQTTGTYIGNSGPLLIGPGGSWYSINGSEANVQIYNTSLPAQAVKQLYLEGIGGVPVDLHYLSGWWPLNGDFGDYSGNNDAGSPYNIAFNGTWDRDYAGP